MKTLPIWRLQPDGSFIQDDQKPITPTPPVPNKPPKPVLDIARKPGRPPGAQNKVKKRRVLAPHYTDDQRDILKRQITQVVEAEEADNISEACDLLGISKIVAYHWAGIDKTWAAEIKQAQNIKADRLEAKLDASNQVVGWIFRLKKLRPEYRDTYKFDITTERLEKMLKELRELGQNQQPVAELPLPKETTIEVLPPQVMENFKVDAQEES